MNWIMIRFYGQLNDFLRPDRRQVSFEHRFSGNPSVKDLIESLGIPHTEVDLLLVNGSSVDFSCQIHGGERVAVYPKFGCLEVSEISLVHPNSPSEHKFVLDVHLGKLAGYLRMTGFDTLYDNSSTDEELADISIREKRILLTFDRNLLKRRDITLGYIVRAQDPFQQLIEVINHYELCSQIHPFTRCMVCNGALAPTAKESVLPQLPDLVKESLTEFYRCQKCAKVYWKGTHYEHMGKLIDDLQKALHC